MGDYFGFTNMANVPNPSDWKHADTAKAWAEKANNSEAHVEAMVELLDGNVSSIDAKLKNVNKRVDEVTTELEDITEEVEEAATLATTSATSAQASATSATSSATSAQAYATSASSSATTASTAATNASNSASQALDQATAAGIYANNASTSATAAAGSATAAAASVATITDEVEQCADSATSALASATSALASENAAATSATNAGTYATSASASRNEAASYASAANTSKLAAAVSATNAATSETNAANSATTASTAASTASSAISTVTAAKNAAETASLSASTSATTATNAATDAGTAATLASGYATTASNAATTATTKASEASASADRAEQAAATVDINVIDNLTSESATDALSAKQGKTLKGLIDNIPVTPVVDNYTSTSTTSALSAKKGKELNDLFNGVIHRDHRVRVHINLPFKDHLNDNDGFNHTNSCLGFSGGNLCPDSGIQYEGKNIYSGAYSPSICFTEQRGHEPIWMMHSTSTMAYNKSAGRERYSMALINTSPGKTDFSVTTGVQTYGRIHTGWCSWMLPGWLGAYTANDIVYNWYSTKASFGVPYTKLMVPACPDLNEDTSFMPWVVNRVSSFSTNTSDYFAYQSKRYTPCNVQCLGRYNKYVYNNSTGEDYDNYRNEIMQYVLPGHFNVNSSGTTTEVFNPRAMYVPGLQFVTKAVSATSESASISQVLSESGSVAGFGLKYRTYDQRHFDRRSMASPNLWHSNPILPYDCGTNTGHSLGISPAGRRFVGGGPDSVNSDSGEYGSIYRGQNQMRTLGIRYFDATAQEWRVFSPGDNCSYGYDGTHWNYREYLWVDLDKPVTYIVGGLSVQRSSDGVYPSGDCQFDWAAVSGASSELQALGKVSPYMVNTYMPEQEGIIASDWCTATNRVGDLIHVETPNFDNSTSYGKWRKLTLMTVDYSSSPLNENNTVYCADSAYGAEETGVLDATKVSCLYTVEDKLTLGESNSRVTDNTGFPSQMLGTNCYPTSWSGSSTVPKTTHSAPMNNAGLMAYVDLASTPTSFDLYENGSKNSRCAEHTVYHIRIGLES